MNSKKRHLCKKAKVRKISECAVCGKILPSPVLEFPGFPLAELFCKDREDITDTRFDLGFCLCSNCGHGQLNTQVDPLLSYGNGYIFKSSSSPGQVSGINNFIHFIERQLPKKSFNTILELGCNDLSILKRFALRSRHLFGIDPIWGYDNGKIINNKIKIIGKYIENIELKEEIDNEAPDIIICRHTLEHLEEPKKVMQKLIEIATQDTLLFFEFPNLEGIVDNFRYNQIFNQHLHYWTVKSFIYLLESLNCSIKEIDFNGIGAWSSLMISFKLKNNNSISYKNLRYKKLSTDKINKGYNLFKEHLYLTKKCLSELENPKICGYGAAVNPPILAYHMESDLNFLEVIWDDDPEKDGLWYANLPICIKRIPENLSLKDYIVIITEPDAARPIISRLRGLMPKQIIIPGVTI